MRRRVPHLVALVAVVAVAVPGFTDDDSFPLSNYPMFSRDRGAVARFDTAIGFDAEGGRHWLTPELIGGSYEVIHAAQTVTKAVDAGDAASLCREIAARASGRSFVQIEVVTETYDTVAWFEGSEVPLRRQVHARCEVSS